MQTSKSFGKLSLTVLGFTVGSCFCLVWACYALLYSPLKLCPTSAYENLRPTPTAADVNYRKEYYGRAKYIAWQGSYLYSAVGPELTILDISDPIHPSVASKLIIPHWYPVSDLYIVDRYAYIETGHTIWIVDISNPREPILTGSFSTNYLRNIAISGNFAYVTTADCTAGSVTNIIGNRCGGALHTVDITNPAKPEFIGCYEAEQVLGQVLISGNYGYMGQLVMDISNPNSLAKVSTYGKGLSGLRTISGPYIYVNDVPYLHIFDISNPKRPAEIADIEIKGIPVAIEATEHYVYIINNCALCQGLRIIDVSNPYNPVQVGFHSIRYDMSDLAVTDEYAYIVESPKLDVDAGKYVGGSLRIINISDPANPIEVGVYVPQ